MLQVPKLQSTFSTQLLSAIDDECIKNNEIAKKIARRMELFSELGYYQSKVNELRDEREKVSEEPSFWLAGAAGLTRCKLRSICFCVKKRSALTACFVCVRLVFLVSQRSGKGKPESADNIEKFDRNCKKLGENATQRTAAE